METSTVAALERIAVALERANALAERRLTMDEEYAGRSDEAAAVAAAKTDELLENQRRTIAHAEERDAIFDARNAEIDARAKRHEESCARWHDEVKARVEEAFAALRREFLDAVVPPDEATKH